LKVSTDFSVTSLAWPAVAVYNSVLVLMKLP
jgi:hypothetical protein